MASTLFVDGTTPVIASWLNDVNNAVYNGVFPVSPTFANLTSSGTLTVGGATTLDGTLSVVGNTTLTGTLTVPSITLNSILLSGATGGTAIGFEASGTGAVLTTVGAKLAYDIINVFDYFSSAQITDVLAGTLTQDVTTAIQNAVTANAGKRIWFPAGKYRISSQINIVNGCSLQGVYGNTTIVLYTQNQNGFVIGNGTSGGQTTSIYTQIDGFVFNPSSTVAAFTSGACIYLDYVYYCKVTNCFFYGSNGSANILYTGVTLYQATECWVTHSYFYYLLGYGIYGSGSSGTLRTVDCRLDFNEFASFIGLDCIHLDANCAGCTINMVTMYSFYNGNSGSPNYGIVLNGGTNGTLHYISQPDIEADGNSGGIYVESGANIDIDGGWIGTSTFNGNTPSLLIGASANSVKVTGMQLLYGTVVVNGAACNITGCDIVGNGVASSMGLQIGSGATDTGVVGGSVRQHPLGGIQFTSTPPAARCKIVGVNFKAVGPTAGTGYEVVGSTGLPGSIVGISGTAGGLPPVIHSCQSDFPYTITATGTPVTALISASRDFYQLTSTTGNITNITPQGQGTRITIQTVVSGTTTFASGSGSGGIVLKTGSTFGVSQYGVISFRCDGINWFQD